MLATLITAAVAGNKNTGCSERYEDYQQNPAFPATILFVA